MHEKIRYFSLFSGIGGFELGIQKADDNKCPHISKESEQEERKERWKRITEEREVLLCSGESTPLCVGYSEVNKYAIQTYQRHFPEHKNYGDATKIETESLPDFDMLCGGFPCQSFSIAGKRKGFQDIRGTLFFEIYRIAKAKKPRLLFLENVKGLLSADDGRCFGTIITSLDELGYDVEWQVLNSKNFGVPQNRERVFIIGHLRGTGGQAVFPLGQDDTDDERAYETEQGSREGIWNGDTRQDSDCISIEGKGPSDRGTGDTTMILAPNNREHKAGDGTKTRKRYLTDTVPSLQAKTGHTQQSYVTRTPLKYLNRNQRDIDGDYSFTIDSVNTGGISDGTNIRRLTPTECERLQGFPDGWTDGVSDTQRYKQLGNAVTVNVIEAIGRELIAL